MPRGRRIMLATLVAAGIVALDQLSKHWAHATLPFNRRVTIIPGWLNFDLTENSGAAFSFLSGHNGLFTLVTAGLLLLIAAIILLGLAPDRLSLLALGAILGGGLSNLLDRLGLSAVVDFIEFRFWPADFNLADLAIRLGAAALILAVVFRQVRRNRPGRSLR